MSPQLTLLIASVVSFFISLWIHPYILKLAKMKNITDVPDKRKLQKEPVPVMGGHAVLFGILAGLLVAQCALDCQPLLSVVIASGMMLYLGSLDDILNLSPAARFCSEIVLAIMLIYGGGLIIDDFHGLFGIHQINHTIAVPLTVLTFVGIVNAINLIDGVDGLSSGFGIMTCGFFCVIFGLSEDWCWAVLALITATALLPFFLHNVFGSKSHIYIGDGGTLLLGTYLAAFVIEVLRHDSPVAQTATGWHGLCLIAMVLALLAEPIADCLRVMGWRVVKGLSPFHADRTHMHHLFIEARFSHLFTTFFILVFNLLVLGVWYLSYWLGADQGWQLLIVIGMAVLVDFGFYYWMSFERKENSRAYRHFVWFGIHTHFKRTGFWKRMRRLMDGGEENVR